MGAIVNNVHCRKALYADHYVHGTLPKASGRTNPLLVQCTGDNTLLACSLSYLPS